MKGRIKVGSVCGQDHGFGRWPWSRDNKTVDPDMIFDMDYHEASKRWDCRADGFGRRSWDGEPGGYGCGSIDVSAGCVILIGPYATVRNLINVAEIE